MLAFAGRNGLNDRKKLIDYGMALVQKYGEGSGELACEMYDAIARLQGARVPAAKPADIPDYGEVAKICKRGAGASHRKGNCLAIPFPGS